MAVNLQDSSLTPDPALNCKAPSRCQWYREVSRDRGQTLRHVQTLKKRGFVQGLLLARCHQTARHFSFGTFVQQIPATCQEVDESDLSPLEYARYVSALLEEEGVFAER